MLTRKLSPIMRWITGDLVYEPFNPKRAGKVISVRTTRDGDTAAKVKWTDGTTTEECRLKSLEHLVEETKKKFQNHSKRLDLARNL